MPTESLKQQIIAYRQSKYGINETTGRTNLNSEVRSDLHNSIQNLSEGLYSKQSHFIFELIQNAEDNAYAKDMLPELVIELLADDPTNTPGCQGCLCIYNNEMGFEFANIKAISSIGGSTKAKAKAKGYIGEKGIGFKSVFAVSPQPHIISNGYQICFKEKDEQAGLGYVIPYWLESIPSCAAKAGFNTVILLPLKQEAHQDVFARIGDELLQLKPETTLFLNKLQKLTLITPKRHASFCKTTKGAVTTLSRTENSETLVQHYWLQRQLVNVPQSLQEEKRAGVTKRDISLAFPIGHQLTSSPLFAYLPTEMETGLPFLINADFLLVASRESVRESLPWNAWLREQVAKFAADKLSSRLSTTRKFDEFAWIPYKLRCTNLFFEPIFQQIIGALSKQPILPDRHGQRRLASHCRIDTGEDWFNVLSPTYLVDSQAQYLLEPQLANFWHLLDQLGAKQLDVVALCTLINHSDKARKQNAAWFLTLYQWLQRHWPQTDDLNERAIALCSPLIKTSQSNVVSGNCLIYEPSNKRISFPQLVDSEGYQADYYLLDNKLRLLLLADTACREFIKDILKIKSLTPTEFVKQVALPFTKKRIASLSDATLWQLTEFIFKHWWDFSDELKSDFSKAFPIKISSGGWYYRNKNLQVVTPAKWSGSEIWQTIFAEDERSHFVVLADQYLQFQSLKKGVLKDFFDCIDIREAPSLNWVEVRKSKVGALDIDAKLHQPSYVSYLANEFAQVKSMSVVKCKVDVLPKLLLKPEFNKLEASLQIILHWLTALQQRQLNQARTGLSWTKTTLTKNSYGAGSKQVDNALFHVLTRQKWLASAGKLYRSDEVFLPTAKNLREFADLIPFIEDDIQVDDTLAKTIGLCKDISAQALIAMLESWSNENKTADIKLLSKIYQKLADDKQVNLTEQLADKALIYCPSGKHNWCQINQAIWQDHHDVFHDSYHWLSQCYSEKLKKFWVDDIGIAESVEPEHFAQAWLKLQKLRIKDDGEVVRTILQSLHRELISYARLADSEERTETWWLAFKNKAKCFTVQGTWLDKRKVYVGDLDTSNTKVFKNAGVPLFWRESGRSNSHYEPLYQALALPRLSSSVSLSLAKQQGLQAPSHSFLTNSTKLALAYFVRDCAIRSGNESVEWLSDNRVLQAILMADENEAPQHRLLVQALVGDYKVQLTQHAYFDIELRQLIYVADNDRDSQKEAIAIELARLLFPNEYKQAEDTIFKLLEISSDKRLEQIRQRKDWGAKFVKDENKLIQRLLQGMSLPLQDDELNTPDPQPKTENVLAKELVLPIALDNGKTMQISSNSNEVTARSVDTLNTFTSSSTVKSPSIQDDFQLERAAERLSCDESDVSYPRSGSRFDTASRLNHNPVRAINDGILATPMHKRSLGTSLSTITSRDISGNALSHQEEHQQEGENNRNTGMRFISYVNPKADEVAYNPQLTGQAKAIGDEAEKLVVKALADLGYQPKHLGGNNPGYDIEAINPLTGEIIFVEVKGIRGAWNHTGVALSASQASICRQYTDNFWLVVVENLASTPLLHMLVNPLNKIDKYYFDQNWVAVAEEMTAL